jgi:hypothetical protein
VSDIDTAVVDSLKALDPKRPIREADINSTEAGRFSLAVMPETTRYKHKEKRCL